MAIEDAGSFIMTIGDDVAWSKTMKNVRCVGALTLLSTAWLGKWRWVFTSTPAY